MNNISDVIQRRPSNLNPVVGSKGKSGSVPGFKNKRDQLIKESVIHINLLREGTKYRKETPANLAKRVNMNKFLLDDSELEFILKGCRQKNNYSHFYWLIKSL